jgi:hypothetical protein
MKRCTQCILPSSGINIKFADKGICNFCRTYEKHKAKISDFDGFLPLFKNRIDRVRGKYHYDCMIGICGGKDSSYVAYQLCQKYDLNPLLVTFDNGYLTDYARDNIKRIVEKLGKDHMLYVLDA